jgi:hypothetical protein
MVGHMSLLEQVDADFSDAEVTELRTRARSG